MASPGQEIRQIYEVAREITERIKLKGDGDFFSFLIPELFKNPFTFSVFLGILYCVSYHDICGVCLWADEHITVFSICVLKVCFSKL